jgi:hypothetical protein
MKRAFKTRPFTRWMHKTQLTDESLRDAVEEMSEGLIDAELGGGLVKKRIGLPGRGKRGGIRIIIATNKADRWFFLYGFEKTEKSNISPQDADDLKLIGEKLLRMNGDALSAAIAGEQLQEIEL